MDLQAFGNDLADRHARAERAEGILEDNLQPIAQRPHLAVRESVDILANEADAPL